MDKKGVSPLIATVVLIGFAVSIGAVIMNWGRTAFEGAQDQVPSAGDNLAWYLGSNVEGVCYSEDSIRMTIKSDPKINIKSIFIASKGRQDFIYDNNIDVPQGEGQGINVKVPYDTKRYGEISKLILGSVDNSLITTPQKCT